MADLGGVRKSTKPLKPPTNSGTTINSGMIDQVSSSIVLCSLVFCAISFAARDLARYFVQKRSIAQKIATVKNSDIQKYGESGSFGRVGSEPNQADAPNAREARVDVLAIIALRSRSCASCRASKEPSENQPIGRRSRHPPHA